jgi:hypothetical protein
MTKLRNETELENTRRKLASLVELIAVKEGSASPAPARDWSLESMRRLAGQLRSEIEEYEASHQTA